MRWNCEHVQTVSREVVSKLPSTMYRRILVPVDGSRCAARGLSEAVRLARDRDSRIRLVHVMNDWVVGTPDVRAVNPAEFLNALREAGGNLLQEAESVVRTAGVPVDKLLVDGHRKRAGAAILGQARAWPADLIVCGTHGRRGLQRALMGSDAEYVIRRTPVPVLLVRIGAGTRARR